MRASLFAVLSIVVAGGAFQANASPLSSTDITIALANPTGASFFSTAPPTLSGAFSFETGIDSADITSTPEPDAMVLMGVALIALSLIARKRRNSRHSPKTRGRSGD